MGLFGDNGDKDRADYERERERAVRHHDALYGDSGRHLHHLYKMIAAYEDDISDINYYFNHITDVTEDQSRHQVDELRGLASRADMEEHLRGLAQRLRLAADRIDRLIDHEDVQVLVDSLQESIRDWDDNHSESEC